jgi:hypothetical protein
MKEGETQMNTWLEDLLEEATRDVEVRRALLEDAERVVAERGYVPSQEELEFLTGLRDQLACAVVASFGGASSEQLASAGPTLSAARFAQSQGVQAARQASAMGFSPAAQQFAYQATSSSWAQAATSQAAARTNFGQHGSLQLVPKRDSSAK